MKTFLISTISDDFNECLADTLALLARGHGNDITEVVATLIGPVFLDGFILDFLPDVIAVDVQAATTHVAGIGDKLTEGKLPIRPPHAPGHALGERVRRQPGRDANDLGGLGTRRILLIAGEGRGDLSGNIEETLLHTPKIAVLERLKVSFSIELYMITLCRSVVLNRCYSVVIQRGGKDEAHPPLRDRRVIKSTHPTHLRLAAFKRVKK